MSDATYTGYTIGKTHVNGNQFCAVVIDRATWKVVYRSPVGNWTKAAKSDCAAWIERQAA